MHRLNHFLCLLPMVAGISAAADLTGNWVVSQDMHDGTWRKTYLNLRQQDGKITGSIRATQFFYTIVESTGGPDGFTVTGRMMDGSSERKVQYEGKLAGDELHVGTRRRADAPLSEMVAHRAPAGEGAMPARIEPPKLHQVADNGLVRTPPMGWNSWNKFAGRVTADDVRSMADAMSSNGMKDAGYTYINIDDTWEGERDAKGNITTNRKFPDMKALADYVHSKGLKLGIYSSPGPNTCAGYEGTYGHEVQDARTYAVWGIDYLKYDWCGARNIYTDEEMQAVYQKMGDALRSAGRPIVYSLCQYGRADVWKWGAEVGGNLWRTTGDIRDTWDSMSKIGFAQSDLAPHANPGHWNDPDMLEIGNGGMNETEYRTHMSLWSLLAAPLLAGNDLRSMTPAISEILTNREVIAIDQDPAGKQGHRISKNGDQEVWIRPLAGGAFAVGLFNRSADEARVSVEWSALGIQGRLGVRDLWSRKDLSVSGAEYSASVPSHGVVLLRVSPEKAALLPAQPIGGRDTGYPAVNQVNARLVGYDGLKALIADSRTVNANVSLSDNYDDAYKSSPAWDPAYIARQPDGQLWESRDWTGETSYILSPAKYMAGPGPERVRYTCEHYCLRDTYLIDVLSYYPIRNDWDPEHPASGIRNLQEGRYKVLDEFKKCGLDIVSEQLRYASSERTA